MHSVLTPVARRRPCWLQEVEINGHKVGLRYNDTCHFYQPPRAHHCSTNDNCVEKFDHHCPWVGTTVGRRNYRSFLLFIFNSTLLCMWVVALCCAHVALKRADAVAAGAVSPLSEAAAASGAALAVGAYTLLFLLFVGGLSCFHSYLVCTNQTTYENFRRVLYRQLAGPHVPPHVARLCMYRITSYSIAADFFFLCM